MIKRKSIFGWKSVLYNYGWKGILLDSILPLIISATLCFMIYLNGANVYDQLKHLLSLGISIVPAMIALILTAYTIMLSFIIGDKFISIRKMDKGKELIEGLNSTYAACLLVSTISIITMIIVSSVANMKIKSINSDLINYRVFFFISYLLLYSITILIGIVIDIFNSGQSTLLDEDSEKTNK